MSLRPVFCEHESCLPCSSVGCTAGALKSYRVFVTNDDGGQGYLGCHGGMTSWASGAADFGSLKEAEAAIAARGWENSTAAVPGKMTAYAVEAL